MSEQFTPAQKALIDVLRASPGLQYVLIERQRQFDKEYTIEFDRQEHKNGGLLTAARAYIWAAGHLAERIRTGNPGRRFLTFIPFQWPWMNEDWKPDLNSPNQNLIRACAL